MNVNVNYEVMYTVLRYTFCPYTMINLALINKTMFNISKSFIQFKITQSQRKLANEIDKHAHFAWHASKSPWLTRKTYTKFEHMFWDRLALEKQTWYKKT